MQRIIMMMLWRNMGNRGEKELNEINLSKMFEFYVIER